MEEFVGGVQLSNMGQVLPFADDIVMVTERKEDIQTNLEVLKGSCGEVGDEDASGENLGDGSK